MIEKIINNEDAINNIIESIRFNFVDIITKLRGNNTDTDVYNFFYNKYPNIFVQIMYNIFKDNMEIYVSHEENSIIYKHIIISLGENCYDIRGQLTPKNEDFDLYRFISYEEFKYLENNNLIGNKLDIDNILINELSNKAINTLTEIINNNKYKL